MLTDCCGLLEGSGNMLNRKWVLRLAMKAYDITINLNCMSELVYETRFTRANAINAK